MANKPHAKNKRPQSEGVKVQIDPAPGGLIGKPSHYQKTMVVDLQTEPASSTLVTDEEGNPASCTVSLEAKLIMEAYFRHDSHLAQAWTYLARVGRKDNPSQEIAKAAWWLLRWLVVEGAEKELTELLNHYNLADVQCELETQQEQKA